jgi:Fe2+ or Zn2+ uptake regulation protein
VIEDGYRHTTRDLFERHSLRCTAQRVAVYEALGDADHPTAEELYRMVRSRTSKLSLATVYNALEALCRAGLARRLATTDGRSRYDADTSDHLHVRDRETSRIHDVPGDLSERLLRDLPQNVLRDIEREFDVRIEGLTIQLIASRPGS